MSGVGPGRKAVNISTLSAEKVDYLEQRGGLHEWTRSTFASFIIEDWFERGCPLITAELKAQKPIPQFGAPTENLAAKKRAVKQILDVLQGSPKATPAVHK